jgi:hypothetical protein
VYVGLTLSLVGTLIHNMVENTLIGGVLFGFVFWPTQAMLLARYWAVPVEAAMPSAGTGQGVSGPTLAVRQPTHA